MSFFSSEKAEETTESKDHSEMTDSWERPEGQSDFYANIYEDYLFIYGLLFGWLVNLVLGNYLLIIMNLSVKCLRAATIYDEFIRELSHSGIVFNLVVGTTEVIRLFYGPLPSLWCTASSLLRHYVELEFFLTGTISALMRLLYINFWYNKGSLLDGFLVMFLKWWIRMFLFLYLIYLYCFYEVYDWKYCFCHGLDSRVTANFRLMDSERNRSVLEEIIGTLNPVIVLLLLVNIKLKGPKIKNNSPHSLRCYHSTVELSLRHFKTYSVIVAYLGVCFLPDYYVSYSQPRDDDLSLFPYNYFIPLTVLLPHVGFSIMAPLVFLWIEEGDTRDSIVSEIKDNKIYTFIMGAAEKFVSNGRVDQD